jgi:hypothetical protein
VVMRNLRTIVSFLYLMVKMWILVAVRSKAWDCGHSIAGAASSNPTGALDIRWECCAFLGRYICD